MHDVVDVYFVLCVCMYNMHAEKRAVWLGNILWLNPMEFSSLSYGWKFHFNLSITHVMSTSQVGRFTNVVGISYRTEPIKLRNNNFLHHCLYMANIIGTFVHKITLV